MRLELVDDSLGHVNGDGKTDALTVCDNSGVDPDHLAIHVQKRSAAVSRIDRGICLNKIVIGSGTEGASFGADDPCGDGLLKTEGAANCQDILQQLDPGIVPACNGIIYLDRERHCDECGREVFAEDVVNWIKESIRKGEVVKSYGNMDTEEFWQGHWDEFERIENCSPGELARMVGG